MGLIASASALLNSGSKTWRNTLTRIGSAGEGAAAGRGRIPSLDGLRALSIGFVLLGHLAGTRYCLGLEQLHRFGDVANLGVRVFFVISGFLITSLLLEELHDTGSISLKMFYLRRTFRIFPAFYAFVAAMWIASQAGLVTLNGGDMAHALTYTINYDYDRSWWFGHGWSLAVEEQFYLLWPAVVVLAGARKAAVVAAGTILAAPLVRLGVWYFLPEHRVGIGQTFPTIADSLAAGCLLACARGWLGERGWYGALMRSRLFFLVPALAFAVNLKDSGRMRFAVLETVMNLAIALTIDRYIRLPGGFTGRMLNSRCFVQAGVLSYSLYLWQQPFLNRYTASVLTTFPLNLLAAFAMAAVSYRLVEAPFLSLRKRIERRWHRGARARATSPRHVSSDLVRLRWTALERQEPAPAEVNFYTSKVA